MVTQVTMQTIPEHLWHRFKLQLGSANTAFGEVTYGSDLAVLDQPTFELVGKRLAVSFTPATAADEQALLDQSKISKDTHLLFLNRMGVC